MALHRDIFWVGRQWAVTGHGLQAVDQKQKSKFDVEISRLWDEDLANGLSAERWFNAEDFSKGLSVARTRYPKPPPPVAEPAVTVSLPEQSEPIEVPTPAPKGERHNVMVKNFHMRVERWPAKFISLWRVRIRR